MKLQHFIYTCLENLIHKDIFFNESLKSQMFDDLDLYDITQIIDNEYSIELDLDLSLTPNQIVLILKEKYGQEIFYLGNI